MKKPQVAQARALRRAPPSSAGAKRHRGLWGAAQGRGPCGWSVACPTSSQTQLRDLAARCARGLIEFCASRSRGRRESRVRAAPAVSCARMHKENAHEHTGSAEAIRPSLRNGFTAYAAISPATNSFCHRHRRIEVCRTRLGSKNLRRLDISNGCQDHAVLPYAKASFVCAPFGRSRVFRQPALRPHHAPNAAASTASHPNVR
jgi:hypothetical protein